MTAESHLPWQPWQMVDEHVVAEITGRSLKSIQRDRSLKVGIPFKKLNGTAVRYRIGDITKWLDAQPSGGAPVSGVETKTRKNRKAA